MKGDSLFSIKDFDDSLLTVAFMVLFFWNFVNIAEDYHQSKRRGLFYSCFLLYFFGSFIAFIFSKSYFPGISIWG